MRAWQVFERVPVQPRDAREASDVFYKQGTGDVLLNYENEVIFTNRQYPEPERLPYVVPTHNIRVKRPPPSNGTQNPWRWEGTFSGYVQEGRGTGAVVPRALWSCSRSPCRNNCGPARVACGGW